MKSKLIKSLIPFQGSSFLIFNLYKLYLYGNKSLDAFAEIEPFQVILTSRRHLPNSFFEFLELYSLPVRV